MTARITAGQRTGPRNPKAHASKYGKEDEQCVHLDHAAHQHWLGRTLSNRPDHPAPQPTSGSAHHPVTGRVRQSSRGTHTTADPTRGKRERRPRRLPTTQASASQGRQAPDRCSVPCAAATTSPPYTVAIIVLLIPLEQTLHLFWFEWEQRSHSPAQRLALSKKKEKSVKERNDRIDQNEVMLPSTNPISG